MKRVGVKSQVRIDRSGCNGGLAGIGYAIVRVYHGPQTRLIGMVDVISNNLADLDTVGGYQAPFGQYGDGTRISALEIGVIVAARVKEPAGGLPVIAIYYECTSGDIHSAFAAAAHTKITDLKSPAMQIHVTFTRRL